MVADIIVQKADTYTELSKITAYEAARAGAYDLARTTDADYVLLETFWAHASATVAGEFREFIANAGLTNNEPDTVELEADFKAVMHFSNSFPPALLAPLGINVRLFFLYSLASEWFAMNLPAKAEPYAALAARQLHEAVQKAYFKAPPMRSKPWEETEEESTE